MSGDSLICEEPPKQYSVLPFLLSDRERVDVGKQGDSGSDDSLDAWQLLDNKASSYINPSENKKRLEAIPCNKG